jgi:hypothetical protein
LPIKSAFLDKRVKYSGGAAADQFGMLLQPKAADDVAATQKQWRRRFIRSSDSPSAIVTAAT